jgi:molecular chaperone Hsp33
LNQEILNKDLLVRAIADNGKIRCLAAVTTELVSEAATRHKTSPTVTAALGRTLTGTLLLGSSLKSLDRLTVQIVCDGPVEGITAEANANGQVRGYARNPSAHVPLNETGKFDVRSIIGNGMFYVTHESGYEIGLYREPYRGSVPIVSGEIGEDFAYYLTHSEQLPSAVLLGVLLRAHKEGAPYVDAAGGVIIQVMPGANPKTVLSIEESVKKAPHTTTMIREGARPLDLLHIVLGGVPFEKLEEKEVGFYCPCSYERAVSLISSIDRDELIAMLHEDKGATMICHFCNEKYELGETELQTILERLPIINQ